MKKFTWEFIFSTQIELRTEKEKLDRHLKHSDAVYNLSVKEDENNTGAKN